MNSPIFLVFGLGFIYFFTLVFGISIIILGRCPFGWLVFGFRIMNGRVSFISGDNFIITRLWISDRNEGIIRIGDWLICIFCLKTLVGIVGYCFIIINFLDLDYFYNHWFKIFYFCNHISIYSIFIFNHYYYLF